MNAVADASPACAAPVQALVGLFERIHHTRMAGLPLLHPALRVQAVGFEPVLTEPEVALGVLVTPWFMSLVRLPLSGAARQAMAGTTMRVRRAVGPAAIDFIGNAEPPLGRFEACSLFSPMQAFADQDGAVAVARSVLQGLRGAALAAPEQPARRGFLLGRPRAEAA